MALMILDLILLIGATLRVSRLTTSDDLGYWFVRRPLYRWARYDEDFPYEMQTRRQKLVSGLDCPFCVGFWVGAMLLASLALAGGPGDAHIFWRYAAGAFTLNYVSAHISARLDGSTE